MLRHVLKYQSTLHWVALKCPDTSVEVSRVLSVLVGSELLRHSVEVSEYSLHWLALKCSDSVKYQSLSALVGSEVLRQC